MIFCSYLKLLNLSQIKIIFSLSIYDTFSYLRSSVIANTVAKCVLRERIYYTALDYFTLSSRTPTQTYSELREDIKFSLEFWNRIVAEKKYLREENFAFNSGGNLNNANNSNMYQQNTPDGSMTGGFTFENNELSQSGQMPLGTSVTYTSISGGLQAESNNLVSSYNNNTQTTTNQTVPIIANSGGGALGQLIFNSNIFIDPTISGGLGGVGTTCVNGNNLANRGDATLGQISKNHQQSSSSQWSSHTISKKGAPSAAVATSGGQSITTTASASNAKQINVNAAVESSQHRQAQQARFLRDYFRKRNLLLYLVSHELDHLYTFHNPFNLPR